MTDAYLKRRASEIPDLVALAASAAFVSKALAALCQASVDSSTVCCTIFFLLLLFCFLPSVGGLYLFYICRYIIPPVKIVVPGRLTAVVDST